jgi:leucyl aminopeptidase
MATRLHSVENLVKVPYVAPNGTTVKTATATVNIAESVESNQDDTLYALFLTPDQLTAENAAESYPCLDWSVVKTILSAQGFAAGSGSSVVVNKAGKPVIVTGISKAPTLATLRAASHAITKTARDTKRSNVVVYIPQAVQVADREPTKIGAGKGVKGTKKSNVEEVIVSANEVIDTIIRGLFYTNWAHDLFTKEQIFAVSNFTLVGKGLDISTVAASAHGAESTTFARELGSLRFSVANNTYMKNTLETLASTHSDVFKIKVMNREQLLAEDYNLICAVNQGSWDPCYIVAIEYTPPNYVETDDNKQPYSFVAKTLTFDTGGYCLKPGAAMLDMHCDKHAGCNQLGLFRYLGLTRPAADKKIVGVWTITDNEIGSKAVHPHTIVSTTSVHGHNLSVAIDNTDAEGRLALGDAVTFVQKYYNPSRIVTSATLTGAILITLGHYMTGLFTNAPYLAEEITKIADKNGEPMWFLPMLPQNYTDLAGKDCDLKNITGSRFMGSSVAAAFIDAFVGEGVEFIHLDIAGTSSCPGNEAAGTPGTTLQHYISSFKQ